MKLAAGLGFVEQNYGVANRVDTYAARQVLSFSPRERFLATDQESIPPSANDWCGALSKYDARGDGDNGELPTLIVNNYKNGEKTLAFFEVTWSPLVLKLKRDHLGYDVSSVPGSSEAVRKRARLNRWIKDDLVDSLFSDAIYYLGAGRESVLNVVAFSICRLWQQQKEIPLDDQRSCDPTSASYLNAIKDNRYVVISESLGSQIVFDALRHDSLIKAVDYGLQSTDSIFMLSNQLPLLELGQRTQAQSTLGRTPAVVGSDFESWQASLRTSGRGDLGRAINTGLTLLEGDIQQFRRAYATRMYQSQYAAQLQGAEEDEKTAERNKAKSQQVVSGLQEAIAQTARKVKLRSEAAASAMQAFSMAQKLIAAGIAKATSASERAGSADQKYREALAEVLQHGAIVVSDATAALYSLYVTTMTELLDQGEDLVQQCSELRGFSVVPGHDDTLKLLQTRQHICEYSLQQLREQLDLATFIRTHIKPNSDAARNSSDALNALIDTAGAQLRHYAVIAPTIAIWSYWRLREARPDPTTAAGELNGRAQEVGKVQEQLSAAIGSSFAIAPQPTLKEAVSAALAKNDSSLAELEGQVRHTKEEEAHLVATSDSNQKKYNLEALKRAANAAQADADLETKELAALNANLKVAQGDDEVCAAKLSATTQRANEIRARYQSPRDDGLAGFIALLQQGAGALKQTQAAELAARATTEEDPSIRELLEALSARLASDAAGIQKPEFVAITDPNDLLGFDISEKFGGRYPGAGFVNRPVKNGSTFLYLYANPDRAHGGYLRNDKVLRLMIDGQ